MDLLIEKLDGSRYYLSQYKVLITDFEESAPSVTRNNMQLNQRNGNIDFGGWHTDKTINITGYYRADDMDEEETLREKLYALLSNPDGYYITQLKTSHETAVERPGETSGNYYDKLKDYPSHKRFLVYTEAPEVELVGNVNGTLLYKLTAEFKTMKLPYGETPPVDMAIESPYKDVPVNLLINTSSSATNGRTTMQGSNTDINGVYSRTNSYEQVTTPNYIELYYRFMVADANNLYGLTPGEAYTLSGSGSHTSGELKFRAQYGVNGINWSENDLVDLGTPVSDGSAFKPFSYTFTIPVNATGIFFGLQNYDYTNGSLFRFKNMKLEKGSIATPWSPNPVDSEYNSWRYNLSGNVSIPYSGTVPCNQLEQQFAIELTARGSASSLSFKIDDTELTYSGGVASGDVFLLNGFSYTKNGLSIVSKTNKAYFILQPDKPNRITCNVPSSVRILGFQNLYA